MVSMFEATIITAMREVKIAKLSQTQKDLLAAAVTPMSGEVRRPVAAACVAAQQHYDWQARTTHTHTISSLSILKFRKRVQRALSIFSYFTRLCALRAVGAPVVWCFRKHSR